MAQRGHSEVSWTSERLLEVAILIPLQACCTVPPVTVDYKPKGSYLDLDGMRVCEYTDTDSARKWLIPNLPSDHTGPSSATSAILFIYDIFGLDYNQTLQGADILAHSDDKHHQYQVFIPDWFKGDPVPLDWFPPDNDEKKKGLGDFFSGKGAPPKTVEAIPSVLKSLTEKTGSKIDKWGIIGFCWGGKVFQIVLLRLKACVLTANRSRA